MSVPEFLQNLDATNNFEKYLTPRSTMESLKPTSCAHDLVGIVHTMETRYVAGNDNTNKKVMNVVLKIKDNSQWPMAIWDDDVDRLEKSVIVNHVIHIDAVYVKSTDPKGRFSLGHSIGFSCQTNTLIHSLNNCNPQQMQAALTLENESINTFEDIQCCVDEEFYHDSKIGIVAYVKTPFIQGNPELSQRIGVLTDTHIKITTYIKNYNDSKVTYGAGEKIKALGYLIENKGKIYFEIKDLNDIIKLDEQQCSFEILRKVMNTPQKPGNTRERDTETNRVSKKLCLDE